MSINYKQRRRSLQTGLTVTSPLYNGNLLLKDIVNDVMQSSYFLSMPEALVDYSDTAKARSLSNRPTDIMHFVAILQVTNEFYRILQDVVNIDVELIGLLDTVKITSQYRTEQVNKSVGGSSYSLHKHGLALDFIGDPRILNAVASHIENYLNEKELVRCLPGLQPFSVYPYECIKYYTGSKHENVKFVHLGFKYIDKEYFNRQKDMFNP